ncbi:ABC transporter ATP-binding protein [Thalassospira marina]|uniref:Spermidine/putrescine import ATP-binding protein PotA n=1 Tax=Thalassospira marina TaxID=2048283 RepID=A0A2N3KYJ1_9PROT|nr:ABC transporter ATP-binding protein [Thalassospira marina]PKR55536.1 spermidine/putrescine ABC transporter ATP-binding protein [Thalassospira marina]
MSDRDVVISARAVSKRFGTGPHAVHALDDVSVDIFQNEFFTMLGPSGCGKTTLLRLIGGFEQASDGEIALEGRALNDLPPFKRPINTVFQSYALFPHLTVRQNITFGLEMQNMPKDAANRRADEMLELVRLAQFGDRQPSQLSGGQQQRIALARALAPAPKVLLLDEPLSALDLKLRKEMQIELKRLQTETGITFVFVTHDQEEALAMSDRIAVMQAGKILQIGSPREIYENPTHRFVADFIGDSNFLQGDILPDTTNGIPASLALPGGQNVSLAGVIQNGSPSAAPAPTRATIAIRPERIMLQPRTNSETALHGRIDDVVYFGTDTTYHISLDDQTRLLTRVQNRDGAAMPFARGDQVDVTLPAAAIRILVD